MNQTKRDDHEMVMYLEIPNLPWVLSVVETFYKVMHDFLPLVTGDTRSRLTMTDP